MAGVIFLIVGPSGCGKSTIVDELTHKYAYKAIKSYTTRQPRHDGEDGHIFVTDEEFDKLTDIVAYTEYDGHRYCATAEQIDNSDLYIIDPDGVGYFKEKYHGEKTPIVVGISCGSTTRTLRMLSRGDSEKDIDRRIAHDNGKFDLFSICDYILPNEGSVDRAVILLRDLMRGNIISDLWSMGEFD